VSEWQPIETAPRETPVLIWIGDRALISQQLYEQANWEDTYQSFWFWDTDRDELPTHWMPLPEPPK
jgi:hypothetical protein